ncbi:MAG: hypothetical protein ACXWWI_07515, partial [Nitrospira sp.]
MDDLSVSLSISLDTLDRNRYERIRGADQLPAAIAGLDLLQHQYWYDVGAGKVVTTSGIWGTITNIGKETVTLQIA